MRLLILGFILSVLAGCATTGDVNVYLQNITPMPSTLFEQRARLDLRIQNLSEAQIDAQGIDVAVKLNGKRWARGVSPASITVDRLSEAQTSVVVSTSLLDSIVQLLGLNDLEQFTYTLHGKLITPGLDRRFSKSGEISRADLQKIAGQRR